MVTPADDGTRLPPDGKLASLRIGLCWLPGLDPSTMAAFNTRPDQAGWSRTIVRSSMFSDFTVVSGDSVTWGSPSFGANGKQALVVVRIDRTLNLIPRQAIIAYTMVLLVELQPSGAWTVSHHALLAEEPLN